MANYVLGRGKLFFDPFIPGTKTKTGQRYFGNTTEFNLTLESEKLDHFSSDSGIRTKDDSTLLELNRTGSFTTDDITAENLALFVLGDVSTVTQASTPVTGEALGVMIPGRYYQLGASTSNPVGVRGVSAVTITPSSGSAVAGTDYTLDADLGRIYIIGGVFDGVKTATAAYTPAANTRERVTTNASASVEGELTFISHNAKGVQKDWVFPYVTVTPSGDFGLKSDDWQAMSFDFEVGELTGVAAIYIDGRPAA